MEHQYSGQVLDPWKADLMRQTRTETPSPVLISDILKTYERNIAYVSSPDEIAERYDRLTAFAGKVIKDIPQVAGAFIEGIPACFVPHARALGDLDELAVPEIIAFQQKQLSNLQSKAGSQDHEWRCTPCLSQQEKNPSFQPDQAYIDIHCANCDEAFKPRPTKAYLDDDDLIFITAGQIGAEDRIKIWNLSRSDGFAQIYQDLDKIITGEKDPLDIWLITREELEQTLGQIQSRPDWFNQFIYPYDLFRYLTPVIGPDRLPDKNFSPSAILQYQVLGNPDLVDSFRNSMHQLVNREGFEDTLRQILSGTFTGNLANYWGKRPFWPAHFQRIFMTSGQFHPILRSRLDFFKGYATL